MSISNSDDINDSREVMARITELEGERDDYRDNAQFTMQWAEEYPDDAEELAALTALAEGAEGYSDWQHGATLIRDSYFEDYAREFAEDIGALENCGQWPATCIDWERAARELQMDYTAVEFGDVTYWVR
jgi:hypothetical protein